MSLGIPSFPVHLHESPSDSLAARAKGSEPERAEFSKALQNAQQLQVRGTGAPRRAIPKEHTQLSGQQAADALSSAWEEALGTPPSKGTLSVLTAQWAHETGRGKAMMNFNFGGIKGTGPTGLTAAYATHEGWGDQKQSIRDGFRAYESADAGAKDYVSLLVRRYPQAVSAAERQDPAAFVSALRDGGYFTGDPQAYTRSVTSLANQAYQEGFGALGSASGSPSHANPSTPSTADYFASPYAGLLAESSSDTPWQSILSADEVSRVTLLMSSLPTFHPNSTSEDSDNSKR